MTGVGVHSLARISNGVIHYFVQTVQKELLCISEESPFDLLAKDYSEANPFDLFANK